MIVDSKLLGEAFGDFFGSRTRGFCSLLQYFSSTIILTCILMEILEMFVLVHIQLHFHQNEDSLSILRSKMKRFDFPLNEDMR